MKLEEKIEPILNLLQKLITGNSLSRPQGLLNAYNFPRAGNAHRKLGNLQAAKSSFENALTEHRTPDYRLNLSEVEAAIKKQEEEAYINPELAEAEKLKGNEW